MATRVTHMRKAYVHADGTSTRSAKEGWIALRFEMLSPVKTADDKFTVVDTLDIEKSRFPANILDCAAGHGFMQKIGDDLAGLDAKAAKDAAVSDPERGFADYIAERINGMVDNLANGIWVEEGDESLSGGVTMLLEAVQAAFVAQGTTLTPEQVSGIKTKLADKDYRDKVKARPDVKKALAEATAARAAERAKKAKADAKLAGPSDLSDLIS